MNVQFTFRFLSDCWGSYGRLQTLNTEQKLVLQRQSFFEKVAGTFQELDHIHMKQCQSRILICPQFLQYALLFAWQTHRLLQHSCQAEQTAAVHHSSPSVHLTSQIAEVATGESMQALQTANELRYTRTEIWCDTARTNLQHSEWSEAVQAWYFVPASLQQFVCTCCYSLWMLYVHFSKSTCPKSDRKWQWLSTIVLGLLHKYIKI